MGSIFENQFRLLLMLIAASAWFFSLLEQSELFIVKSSG